MNLVYSTSTDDFQPISFGDSYLYDNYGRLSSFLKNRLSSADLDRLAKPILGSNKKIDWFSLYDAPMTLLTDSSEETQVSIEKEYLELVKKIQRTIVDFKNSQDKDKEQWASILNLVFNPEDNKLLYNGKDWIFIWGWQFRNKLIIQNPNFLIPEIPEEIETNEVEPNNEIINDEVVVPELAVSQNKDNLEIPEIAAEQPIIQPVTPIVPVVPLIRKRISFWERIKRFFRWLAYRFWGLMMLIVFTLIVLCLCKTCCKETQEDCSIYENVDKELKMLEDRVKERCPKANEDSTSTTLDH
jgi:hypothetical protein